MELRNLLNFIPFLRNKKKKNTKPPKKPTMIYRGLPALSRIHISKPKTALEKHHFGTYSPIKPFKIP